MKRYPKIPQGWPFDPYPRRATRFPRRPFADPQRAIREAVLMLKQSRKPRTLEDQ